MKKIISSVLIATLMLLAFSACSFSREIRSLSFNEPSVEMTVGDTRSLDISAEPANAILKKLTWTSSNNNIVSVNDGTIRAVSAGNAVITVKTERGVSKSCNVSVKDKVITGISLNESTVTVKKGSKIQLEANITPVDAPTGDLKWSSSDDSIATVNSSGYVTGVKAGVVNIICKSSSGVEASCTVTVEAKSSSKSDKTSDSNKTSDQNKTVVNNFYGYGHYHPDYVYSASDFVFPESSSRKLTRSEISATLSYMSGYSPSNSYVQDAINEIYARNGYVFQTASIRNYYESKAWYYPDYSFNTSMFSSIETYNISLLEEFN